MGYLGGHGPQWPQTMVTTDCTIAYWPYTHWLEIYTPYTGHKILIISYDAAHYHNITFVR